MNKEEDMSNTFVAEVGQKSAIFNQNEEIESLEESKENSFPEVKIDPPTEMPTILEEGKNSESQNEEKTNQEEDDEFLEAKKKKKSKKYKKRNPFVTFLIMIICLAIGAGASYYYFEVYAKDNNNDDKVISKCIDANTVKKYEEISPSSIFIQDLVEKYDDYTYFDVKVYQQLYGKDKTTVSDLDLDYIKRVAVGSVVRIPNSFAKDKLKDGIDKLFGKDKIKYEDSTIDFTDFGCGQYKLQNDLYTYVKGDGCGGTTLYNMSRKIVKTYKENDKLYVNVAIAIDDGNKVYKKYNSTTSLAEEELTDVVYASFDIDKDYTKLNQYQYTFNYDKELDNYYLESIELIK